MSIDNETQQLSEQTIEYYNQELEAFVSNTLNLDMSSLYLEFVQHIKPKGHILDAGCGPGRDSLYFINQDFRVTAFDASKAMVTYATKFIGQTVLQMKFDEVSFVNMFDGVWACASLLHVPLTRIDDVLTRIIRSLVKGGIIYSSFKYGEQEIFKNGRIFSSYTEKTFMALISRHPGLSIVKIWQTTDIQLNRTEEIWLNTICRKEA